MAANIRSRSWPARPTKGRPSRSSSAPGRLAQDQHAGLGVAIGEDRVARALLQLAEIESARSPRAESSSVCACAAAAGRTRRDRLARRPARRRARRPAAAAGLRCLGGQVIAVDRRIADRLVDARPRPARPGRPARRASPLRCRGDSHGRRLGPGPKATTRRKGLHCRRAASRGGAAPDLDRAGRRQGWSASSRDRSSAKGAPFGGTSSVIADQLAPFALGDGLGTQTARSAVSNATTSGWPGSGRRTRAVRRRPSAIGSTRRKPA